MKFIFSKGMRRTSSMLRVTAISETTKHDVHGIDEVDATRLTYCIYFGTPALVLLCVNV